MESPYVDLRTSNIFVQKSCPVGHVVVSKYLNLSFSLNILKYIIFSLSTAGVQISGALRTIIFAGFGQCMHNVLL